MADDTNGTEKISVLNPVGFPPKITPKPMAPRLESLDGKTHLFSRPALRRLGAVSAPSAETGSPSTCPR